LKAIKWYNINHPHDLKLEIKSFQDKMLDILQKDKELDFSDATRIKHNAAKYNLDEKSYIDLIEVLDENAFWVDDIISLNCQWNCQ
jgi:hypothetical protein